MRSPLAILRKKVVILLLLLVLASSFIGGLIGFNLSGGSQKAGGMQQEVGNLQLRLQFVESLYRAREEDALGFEIRNDTILPGPLPMPPHDANSPTADPQFVNMLKNISGTLTAGGFDDKSQVQLRVPVLSYQLLPHLLKSKNSLKTMFHMGGGRSYADLVIGVPSVKRDKECYLIITLTQLVEGLSVEDEATTLIVVYIGETDPMLVLKMARQIEIQFPKQLESGLMEVIAPHSEFYPDLDALPPTLGDPAKRFKWRTKQNLDNIFLMTFCQTRATFYLMMEDDVITKKNYVAEIKKFAVQTTIATPHWIVLEFCRVGGIGKLFKSSDLSSFITYIQLFYTNLPIDWLIESYLTDKVCTIEKNDKQCVQSRLEIRPRYEHSLFQHIGVYSSLPGKIQKLKDIEFGTVLQYTPHTNPPLAKLESTIRHYSEHSLTKAYNGVSFFWGLKPKKDDIIEFKFKTPIIVQRFKFRSGSVEHVSDIFYSTIVEVTPVNSRFGDYLTVGQFNELGVAEGNVAPSVGKVNSVRLRVHRDSDYWVILSEILIVDQKP